MHLVSLYPPDGGGRIRVYERVQPLMRMSEVVAFVIARDPTFRITSVRDASALVTSEGEHGAWTTVVGTRADSSALRYIGAVFGDDFVAVVDALVLAPARAGLFEATARALVLGMSLALGTRRRRVQYVPPVGWRGLPSGLVTHWYPVGFPGDAASITVAPAEPSHDDVATIFDGFVATELGRGHVLDGKIEEVAIVTDSGLRGRHWSFAMRARDQRSHRELVACAAPPYVYSMRMEASDARTAEHRAIFATVARSIVAVPAPGERHAVAPVAAPIDLFAYLLD